MKQINLSEVQQAIVEESLASSMKKYQRKPITDKVSREKLSATLEVLSQVVK